MSNAAMKWAAVPLLCALLLGCGPKPLPQSPSLPINDSDFTAALSGAPTSSPLGLSPTLQGQVANWKAKQAQPVALEHPPVNTVGEIQTTEAYQVKLPPQPPAASLKSMESYIRGIPIYSPCAVDTLVISPPTSQAAELSLFTARPIGAALKPQLSPPPNFIILRPFKEYFNATEKAIYASEDTTVKGELSCANPYSDGLGYHLFVNISFTKGWNAATLIYGKDERLQKMLLRGGVTSNPVVP